jgi:hypothetical protein
MDKASRVFGCFDFKWLIAVYLPFFLYALFVTLIYCQRHRGQAENIRRTSAKASRFPCYGAQENFRKADHPKPH